MFNSNTPILDLFLLSEVMTIQQTDGIAYKLKPRLFYKSILQTFTSSVNYVWQYYQTSKFAIASEQLHLSNHLLQFHLQNNFHTLKFK